MYQDKIVLCGANSYEEKFYMNPDFDNLPQHIKDELKIMCVLYVHDVGGILTLVFEENGELEFEVTSAEGDPMFDEIVAVNPGFINLKLAPEVVAEYLNEMAADENLGVEKEKNPKKVIIDYGGPNVAKPLHVGHLRSAISERALNVLSVLKEMM